MVVHGLAESARGQYYCAECCDDRALEWDKALSAWVCFSCGNEASAYPEASE